MFRKKENENGLTHEHLSTILSQFEGAHEIFKQNYTISEMDFVEKVLLQLRSEIVLKTYANEELSNNQLDHIQTAIRYSKNNDICAAYYNLQKFFEPLIYDQDRPCSYTELVLGLIATQSILESCCKQIGKQKEEFDRYVSIEREMALSREREKSDTNFEEQNQNDDNKDCCPGGCYWVENDLCNQCAGILRKKAENS